MYFLKDRRFSYDLIAINLNYQPVQESERETQEAGMGSGHPFWALTMSCAGNEQQNFLHHHTGNFNLKIVITDF